MLEHYISGVEHLLEFFAVLYFLLFLQVADCEMGIVDGGVLEDCLWSVGAEALEEESLHGLIEFVLVDDEVLKVESFSVGLVLIYFLERIVFESRFWILIMFQKVKFHYILKIVKKRMFLHESKLKIYDVIPIKIRF